VGQAVLPARNGWRAGETEKGGRHRKLFSLRDGVPDGCAIRRKRRFTFREGPVPARVRGSVRPAPDDLSDAGIANDNPAYDLATEHAHLLTVQQQNTKGQVGNEIDNPYGVSPEHKFGVAGGMGPATEPDHLWGRTQGCTSS